MSVGTAIANIHGIPYIREKSEAPLLQNQKYSTRSHIHQKMQALIQRMYVTAAEHIYDSLAVRANILLRCYALYPSHILESN